MPTPAPTLTGAAAEAVRHRGSHVQIIAAAGSGKTEVVSQRVVSLIAEGVAPAEIVAFTFTERAAAELKARIAHRTRERLGQDAVDALTGLYVGTIHGYCFQFLKQAVPRYDSYDVLDEGRHIAFLCREGRRLGLGDLQPGAGLFETISSFNKSVQVVENELLDPNKLPEPLRAVFFAYRDALDRYRLMTFGTQISRTVEELAKPALQAQFRGRIRHLIVDEYQDVNPAQERLVRTIADLGAEVCVVGDDDQAIYQWRGSDVSNIVGFSTRYAGAATFTLDVNRRSQKDIVTTANSFATTIRGRLGKRMTHDRSLPPVWDGPNVVAWSADTELDECDKVADLVAELHERGLPYRQIAILVRSRTPFPRLLTALKARGIPVQSRGRSGLFSQDEARCFGRLFCMLGDIDWGDPYQPRSAVDEDDLLGEFALAFELDAAQQKALKRWIAKMRDLVPATDRTADVVGEAYEVLDILAVRDWDMSDELWLNRMGTIARFTNLLADFEAVFRRARPDANEDASQVGGQDRGEWYYKNLGIFIANYAVGDYSGFGGEEEYGVDAVDLTTVHSAKGLEWPAVLIPSITANRFPSSKVGEEQEWLIPRRLFKAARYEGDDADERRLFYVALTRARDWVSISRHERVNVRPIGASPYWSDLGRFERPAALVGAPAIAPRDDEDGQLRVSFSELSAFMSCGWAFRLRHRIGFMPRLAAEIGYGKAVHHVMRILAEQAAASGRVPSAADIDEALDAEFYLPMANKAAHRQLKQAAQRLVKSYVRDHGDELQRTWQAERPFELHLDGVTVSGRADVIFDGGAEGGLTVVDYKTAAADDPKHGLQLQVYASAGRREGLQIDEAFVHDMKDARRISIDLSPNALATAEAMVATVALRMKRQDYVAQPERSKCSMCDVKTVCAHSTTP